eukprot:Gregarina_sp_Poly_1__6511@NODE_348_length_9346_cov_198_894493_g291_i0_p7_GENE_NODE_348_length_9346_cov_198_894493_g291_i0NODE_348_length_9346_cov_198_894493_g291_i0_p7_ORF_typecomplete_len168_score11_33Cytb5/PF00173_28/2_7e07zfTFIIB/PF13453_6/27zfTFIIB/PF13453_6/3_NODE_348_length_9346_cov_198_894493_g291_i088199322
MGVWFVAHETHQIVCFTKMTRKVTYQVGVCSAISPKELRLYDDTDSTLPICVACGGLVFDVSSGPGGCDFYGQNGPYHLFAGRDATVSLAKTDLDPALVDQDYSLITTSDEFNTLLAWIRRLAAKYRIVGYIPERSSKPAPVTSHGYLDVAAWEADPDVKRFLRTKP